MGNLISRCGQFGSQWRLSSWFVDCFLFIVCFMSSSLCGHVAQRQRQRQRKFQRESSLLSLLVTELIPSKGPTFRIDSNPSYLPRTSSPQIITWWIRASPCAFLKGTQKFGLYNVLLHYINIKWLDIHIYIFFFYLSLYSVSYMVANNISILYAGIFGAE